MFLNSSRAKERDALFVTTQTYSRVLTNDPYTSLYVLWKTVESATQTYRAFIL